MLLYRSQHKYGFYMFLHGFTCFYMCLHAYMFVINVFTCFTTQKQGFKWLCAGRFHVQTGTPSTNGLLSISKFEKSGQQLGYRSKLGYQWTTKLVILGIKLSILRLQWSWPIPAMVIPGSRREPSLIGLIILQLLTMANKLYWLVVSTTLKNISQLGLLFPIYGKKTPTCILYTYIYIWYSYYPWLMHVNALTSICHNRLPKLLNHFDIHPKIPRNR